ncbi:MAG: hypothetical protein IPH77_06265 [Ignavibacteria bacterium]|nr:hypothetical protein [Ignavibacteria bacterium]
MNCLKKIITGEINQNAGDLLSLCDYLVKKSVWIMGGDGWAYDIGFGGLDHVMAEKCKPLVLDTEFIPNTGGQMSKINRSGCCCKIHRHQKTNPKKILL